MSIFRRLSTLLFAAALTAGACSNGDNVDSNLIAAPTGEAVGNGSEAGSTRIEAGETTTGDTDPVDQAGDQTDDQAGREDVDARADADTGSDGSGSGTTPTSATGGSNDDAGGDDSSTTSTTAVSEGNDPTTTRPGQDPEPTDGTSTTATIRPGSDPEPGDDAPVEVRENRGTTPRPDPAPVTLAPTPDADERRAMADQDDPTTAELAGDASNDELNSVDRAVIAASSCAALANEVVDGYQAVLDQLGDAGRTDYRAIDEAYEAFGAGGSLIQSRADELGCSPDALSASICRASGRLTSSGQAGDDLVANITAGC